MLAKIASPLTIIFFLVISSTLLFADSLSRGDVEGLRYDKMGRFVGGKPRVDVAYHLNSKGTKTIFLMCKCKGTNSARSIDSAVVSKGSGKVVLSGSVPKGCVPSFYVKWGN